MWKSLLEGRRVCECIRWYESMEEKGCFNTQAIMLKDGDDVSVESCEQCSDLTSHRHC